MNPLVEEALRFSSIRHGGQHRKGSSIPYLSHPFSVALLLETDHQPPTVVAAGLLHDLIEDTKTDPQEILTRFGPDVLRLVLAVSEKNRDQTWEQRKQETLEHISSLQFDEVALLVADKLHNLRSIRYDLEMEGMTVWQRFKRPMRDQSWYYHQLLHAFEPFRSSTDLIGLYEQELNSLFYGEKNVKNQKVVRLFESILTCFTENEWVQESAPLCQTAYELKEIVARDAVDDEEIEAFRTQLELAGWNYPMLAPQLAALQELGYRTAMGASDFVALMRRSIVN
ncbi:HD domain-containing protein [Exiguobacterium sp. B2(2022)]|uniref:HD domain-containing protein n=1 Tax=Exiguobacterium sp. B2(2022) TaxID=2992755 RepID=UPI00237B914F|nr:HD domain-containing protein [Exiguobacterium sp. B2(2022)]MDE0562879.1 HD domain-containing protein [Exiguobacterium sp. B2(2022)]